MKAVLWQGTGVASAFLVYLAVVLHGRLYALALLLPALEWLIILVFQAFAIFYDLLALYLPLYLLPHLLLSLECSLVLLIGFSFWNLYKSDLYRLPLQARSFRRHPISNVFIYGLSHRVVTLSTEYLQSVKIRILTTVPQEFRTA